MISRYGLTWDTGLSDLAIELAMIRAGGCIEGNGQKYGNGLFWHFRHAITLAWPEDDHHRWSDLILKNYLEERITVIMGSRDASKTRTISKIGLIEYWAWPEETLILMTSTTIQGLELRVWGDIKNLFRRARDLHPWLAGNVVDAKHGLFTDDISEEGGDVRAMNKGIIGIPMISSQNEYQGMALKNFAGIKQRRRRLFGDELQFIPVDYLKVLDSLDKGDFKAGFLGNPIAENGKALDAVAEPKEGWANQKPVTKTTTWRNKYNGITVNLVGIDSPNFDEATKNRFSYLVNQTDVDTVASRPGGRDSVEWWSLIMGVRKAGAISDRILTIESVRQYGGFEPVVWGHKDTIKVYGIDAGFGGDPCVATCAEFGEDFAERQVMAFMEPKIIPIRLSCGISPEDQIATFAKADCDMLGVLYQNVFVECGMRATLAVSMGRIMSPDINAVNFGGPATQRPVSNELFVFDEKTRQRRLKTCYEHYSKFVSELAYSVKALVECAQARSFPMRAAEEFQKRKVDFVYNDRHEIETKDKYKARNGGESPNYSDSVMVTVEGARRLGFVIENMRGDRNGKPESGSEFWLNLEVEKHKALVKRNELTYG